MLSVSIAMIAIGANPFALVGSPQVKEPLFPIDPVALVRDGEYAEGDNSRLIVRSGYAYRFASDANRIAFTSDPEKYEIQIGGACGRMGSLSGKGDPTRFAVYDGRIYIFASESCRTTFLSEPSKYLERLDTWSNSTESRTAEAKKLLEKAYTWAGGKRALAGIGPIVVTQEIEQTLTGSTVVLGNSTRYEGLSKCRRTDWYGDSKYGWDINAGGGKFLFGKNDGEVMTPIAFDAAGRLRDRFIPTVLQASMLPSAKVQALGPVGPHHRVSVLVNGHVITLGIDQTSGAIAFCEFMGQSEKLEFGPCRQDFESWTSVYGAKVPTGWKFSFRGEPNPTLNATDLRVIRPS